jgi:hypothetical protein
VSIEEYHEKLMRGLETMRYRYQESITEEGIKLILSEFIETKNTKCGAWVVEKNWAIGKKRFVLDGVGKRYCHETKEMAFDSYKMRKKSQLRYAQNALDIATFMIEQANKLKDAPQSHLILDVPEFWHSYTFD